MSGFSINSAGTRFVIRAKEMFQWLTRLSICSLQTPMESLAHGGPEVRDVTHWTYDLSYLVEFFEEYMPHMTLSLHSTIEKCQRTCKAECKKINVLITFQEIGYRVSGSYHSPPKVPALFSMSQAASKRAIGSAAKRRSRRRET